MTTALQKIQSVNQDDVIFASKCLFGYFLYMFVSSKWIPGKQAQGQADSKGKKLLYTINGLQIHILTIFIYLICRIGFGVSITCVLSKFWSFFVSANIYSIIFSILLFFSGRNSKDYKPHNQNWTPQILNDFWFGATLNPRFLGVDIKMFFYQPSLIGLQLFLLAFAEYQYNNYGLLTSNMIIYQLFWFSYLITHYIREEFMLTTWDIIAENFGLMLVWGDLCYLPFLYSISAWYLCDQTNASSSLYILTIVVFHVLVHYMFRSANWQKDDFRKLGNKAIIWGKQPQTINQKLLISGWWGIGRHLNYTGEILVYLSIALCTGCSSIMAYILPFSLFILLTHRSTRDEKKCKEKYKENWNQYCKIAKFSMIPFIY